MPKKKENEKIMKENTTKVILNVPNDLAEKFKDLALKRGISRSSMILYSMSWFLDYHNQLDMTAKMVDYLKNPDVMNIVLEESKKDL